MSLTYQQRAYYPPSSSSDHSQIALQFFTVDGAPTPHNTPQFDSWDNGKVGEKDILQLKFGDAETFVKSVQRIDQRR